MRTLITGATGLLGAELVSRTPSPVVLTRAPDSAISKLGAVEAYPWQPQQTTPPPVALRGTDVVFNLAGEPVAGGRWTQEKKQLIRDSRILTTRHLVEGLLAMEKRPKVLVSASAVGYYGDRGNADLDENAPAGDGFLSEVCREWESAACEAQKLGVRVVCVRFGIVLSSRGGALRRMLTPFKIGMGGRIGDGKQWVSWIHIRDAVGMLLHAAKEDSIRGPMNAVAPVPVTNGELTRSLAQALHRPAILQVPKAALSLAMGEMSRMLTDSQRVVPQVALRSGYQFNFPDLDGALQDLV